MIRYTILLIAFTALSQLAAAQQTDLKTRVDQQVARVRAMTGQSDEAFFELPGIQQSESPIMVLCKFPMDAIPYLIYLSDTSSMQAYRRHGSGQTRVVQVNEYIIFAINKITDHEFESAGSVVDRDGTTISSQPKTKSTDELQTEIRSWWESNRSKSLLERKINDINDENHQNRFSAFKWLGDAKAKEARLPLEQRIETLLKGEVNSLKQTEMSACADSLARIGDSDSAPAVRRVCDHLSYWVYMSYRPVSEGRTGVGSNQVTTLFLAYHSLAMLGFKDEALSHLRDMEAKYVNEMEPMLRDEFLRTIAVAEKW